MNINFTISKWLAFAVLYGLTINSIAQTVMEEITVTATKRGTQNLQDVPFSVQALSGDKLDSIGAVDFEDFFHFIPGLSVFDQGPGDKRYIIRGVNATGAGTVGLYLDEVIVTGENAQDGGGRQPDIRVFDIERVEVLKGPQGTTFGSSSLSGTIRYITSKPNLQDYEIHGKYGFKDMKDADDLGQQFEAAVSAPLIEDKLAVRVAGLYVDDDGFIDNRFSDGVNSDETIAGRVSLLAKPVDNLSLSLMAMWQDVETDGPSYFNMVDADGDALAELSQADLSRNPFEDETLVYNATVEYESEYGVVTGTISRYDRETVFNRDASLAVGPRSVITQPKDRELDSYEIRFSSSWDLPVQTLVGFFAQNEDRFFQSRIFPSDSHTGEFTEVAGFSLDRNVETSIDELAFFAEFEFNIIDAVAVTGGFRYFDIDTEEVSVAAQGFSGAAGGGRGPDLSFGETGFIGKANLSYTHSDDLMVFAQWSQGFRSGGPNDQTAAAIAMATIPAGFGSDSLDNYEIGAKSSWLDGKIVANASLYYIDWADIQIGNHAQNPTNANEFFPYRGNGGGADIYGIELEVAAQPFEGLELGLVASYIDAELSEDSPIPEEDGMKGDGINYTPESSFTLTGQYTRPLPRKNWDIFFGGDVSYVNDRDTEIRPNNPLNVQLDAYALVNLRLGVRGDDWSAILSVNNAFDDGSVIDVYRIIAGRTPDGFIPQRPRTVVFSISKSF